jgi:hypothetical protein
MSQFVETPVPNDVKQRLDDILGFNPVSFCINAISHQSLTKHQQVSDDVLEKSCLNLSVKDATHCNSCCEFIKHGNHCDRCGKFVCQKCSVKSGEVWFCVLCGAPQSEISNITDGEFVTIMFVAQCQS